MLKKAFYFKILLIMPIFCDFLLYFNEFISPLKTTKLFSKSNFVISMLFPFNTRVLFASSTTACVFVEDKIFVAPVMVVWFWFSMSIDCIKSPFCLHNCTFCVYNMI